MKLLDFLLNIKARLQLGHKDNDFSHWVEDTLCDYYHMFEAENSEIARKMNDTLPDICEQMEPGMESDKFHQELSAEVDRLIALLGDGD